MPSVKRDRKSITPHEKEMFHKERTLRELSAELSRTQRENRYLHSQLAIAEKAIDFQRETDASYYKSKLLTRLKKAKGESTAILILNDWHAAESIQRDQVNNINEYNLDICTRRAKNIFTKSIEWLDRARSQARIDNMVLALLGDFISGAIHAELLESDLLSPIESTLFVQEILVDGINFLRKEAKIKELIIPCCPGNHGRTTQKPRISTYADNSFEFFMYHTLQRYFKKIPNVNFLITKSYHNYLDIHGRKVRFHHGDSIQYYGGSGGPTIPINKAIAAWNKTITADIDYFGHFHSYIDTIPWTLCPSLIGHSPFGIRVKADFVPPGQIFSVVNGNHGKVGSEIIYAD